jgi:hypothetical protein
MEARMSVILFKYHTLTPDKTLKNIHPTADDNRSGQDIIFITVEEENIVRMAMYTNGENGWLKTQHINYINHTGKSITGLPVAFPKNLPFETDDPMEKAYTIRFGTDIFLKPYIPPSKQIGSDEWPNRMTWRRIYKNYYIATVYRGFHIVFENLATDSSGVSLEPYLGESNLNQGIVKFASSLGGSDILLTHSYDIEADYPLAYLDAINPNDALTEDIPGDLVWWIP